MSVVNAVQRVVDSLDLDEAGEARAALALNLAQVLDNGRSPMAAAAISRELRETLAELTGDRVDDSITTFLGSISSPVPATVRNTQD